MLSGSPGCQEMKVLPEYAGTVESRPVKVFHASEPLHGAVRRWKREFLLSQSMFGEFEQFRPVCFYRNSPVSETGERVDPLSRVKLRKKPVCPLWYRRESEVQHKRGPYECRLLADQQQAILVAGSNHLLRNGNQVLEGPLAPERLIAPRKQVGDSPRETIFSRPSGSTTVKGSWLANAADRAPISVSPATTETRWALLSSPIQALR